MYEDLPAFYAGDYGRVRGQHYDIVLNGVEIGGGSVRIHDPEMQEYVFQNVLEVSAHHQQHPFFPFQYSACVFAGSSGPGMRTRIELRVPGDFYYIGPSGQSISRCFDASR